MKWLQLDLSYIAGGICKIVLKLDAYFPYNPAIVLPGVQFNLE